MKQTHCPVSKASQEATSGVPNPSFSEELNPHCSDKPNPSELNSRIETSQSKSESVLKPVILPITLANR